MSSDGNRPKEASSLKTPTWEAEHPRDEALCERMRHMFYPGTVAVIGASHNPAKWGHRVLHSLLCAEFLGRLVPINPKGGEILGLPVARSIAEVTGAIDLALVVLPPPLVLETVEACVRRDVGALFVITAGFSEVDLARNETEAKMASLAATRGIPLGGPNGQGLTCTQGHMCAQMYPIMPPPGGISLVTQSGNIGVTLAHMALHHNMGVSKIISAGNEAALKTAHYLDFLAQDQDTKVVCVYLEGADDGRHLLAALDRVTLRKPVVMLKSGGSALGARAAVSHTGSLAGADRVYDGAFRQAGAVRVKDLQEMFDTAALFSSQPLPRGNRVGMITLGGGWGVLAADAVEEEGLRLPPLPEALLSRLDRVLPERWSRANPIDFAASEHQGLMEEAVELMCTEGAYDALAVLGLGHPSLAAHYVSTSRLGQEPLIQMGIQMIEEADRATCEKVSHIAQKHGMPLVVASDAALSAQTIHNKALEEMRQKGFYLTDMPHRAIKALGNVVRYAAIKRSREEAAKTEPGALPSS